MIIKTKDFTLRPIKLSDAKGVFECHQDKEAQANFRSCPKSIKDAKSEIIGQKNKFAIIVKKEFAGFINLSTNNNPIYKHSANVSYGIHKDFRGQGLATKALKKITTYGFNVLKLKRISGMCRTFNKASARVLEKAGYKHEGTLKKNKFQNGKYLHDMIWAKVK